jgi:chromosome segregation ATPase
MRQELQMIRSTFAFQFKAFLSVLETARSRVMRSIGVRPLGEKPTRLDTSQRRSPTILDLEAELEAKTLSLTELETESSTEISRLQQKVEEQKHIIRELKNRQFKVVQLQSDIDERDRIIRQLKHKVSSVAQQLNAQIMQNEQAANTLNFTTGSLEMLEAAKKAKDAEIADLRQQNAELRQEVRRCQKVAGQLTIQCRDKDLRLGELEQISTENDSMIEKLNKQITEWQNEAAATAQLINSQSNEIAILKAEHSLTSSTKAESYLNQSVVSQPSFIFDRTSQKLAAENQMLLEQIHAKDEQISELHRTTESQSANLQTSENDCSVVKDQLQRLQLLMDRRSTQ